MAIMEILEVPDPRLKKHAKPVDVIDDGVRKIVSDMFDTMYDARGIGLASIQVGVEQAIVVIDLQEDEPPLEEGGEPRPGRQPRVFINPEILWQSDDLAVYAEGCLSIPENYADVERPARCRVKWLDLDGNAHEEEFDGLISTCVQHEMDHLAGIVFIDHVSRLKRDMILKKLAKARKAA
ncbi:peptide deformylase [Sphingomonas panacis]|uniref:Peptide deformylase n=1 Tax=Sphingomonas panacis TaxID=1560345 RepID=A0A1B3ZD79_9SPHN|nr:peptide deformylase [Sphingomonas panacis]AOH85377.1 peptide deformylase [Sphingomonas panacis]